ncbi:uncharacterized protein LOC123542963 [Mercenaria mercenaria]|uniref:uncharacterized protein LOC123542963 n=1 Tax=Mercenaria mercenaria TaxID=6596 RepID=UPI00234F2D54|nr:uncharacterized protein LOC123542963 [Mercenaria mercenaria]
MGWILLLLLSMIYHASYEEQCLNKPCACCSTNNCDYNSTCENGCIDGYWGDKCYYACPVHCVKCEQNSPSICDGCHDGFYNGFWHDGNSYGPWTDNCINKCSPQCKSCFYYQHCKECVDGYYKTNTVQNCTLPCPQVCVSCLSTMDCVECKPGYFGRNCSQLCSKGCNSLTCDKKTGRCNCTSNYMGDTCKYCKHDKYGVDCDLDCPENCFVCNQSDSCLFCKQGYEGPLCAQPISSDPPKEDNHTLSTTLGTVFGILLVIPSVLALLLGWRRWRRTRRARVNETHVQPGQNEVSRSPELQPEISKLSGNIDMEMSVYDEIPGWSTMADGYAVPFDMDDTESQNSDENSGVYREPVDAHFSRETFKDHSDHVQGSELGDKSSNYSFAMDPINMTITEKDKNSEDSEDNSSNYGKDMNIKGEPNYKNEKIAKDNPAFEMEESTKDKETCEKENITKESTTYELEDSAKDRQTGKEEKIAEDKLNSEQDNAGYEKKTDKRRPKKGLKSGADYEKLNTGKANEHIYNKDNIKFEREKIEKTGIVPDTPGYEKPISFKSRPFYDKEDSAKCFVNCGNDNADEHNSSFEKENNVKGTDIEDNLGIGKQNAEKDLQSKDDYEELQKVKNNEHDYEEGGEQLPDYTNVDNNAQSSATFGVFTLV